MLKFMYFMIIHESISPPQRNLPVNSEDNPLKISALLDLVQPAMLGKDKMRVVSETCM